MDSKEVDTQYDYRSGSHTKTAARESSPPSLLFDAAYYVATYPDVGNEKNAWKHFVVWGAKEGRNPHPLFDTVFYIRTNPDVVAAGVNPLFHYVEFGGRECRKAHPLFDEQFYLREHAEVRLVDANPLLHFLERGASAGFNPNHLFDVEFYLRENPDVAQAGVNPLVHYILSGASEGRDPHPLFGTRAYLEHNPDVARSGVNPLRHYLEHGKQEGRVISRPLLFSDHIKIWANGKSSKTNLPKSSLGTGQSVPIFCVYGPSNVAFLRSIVIPAFSRQEAPFPLELHLLNYRSQETLIGTPSIELGSLVRIRDWSDTRPPGHLGFGESMNALFSMVNPSECFLYCNPDSFPMPSCVVNLAKRYSQEESAIVEASQWPTPHPKEFDPVTHETPWASGAFGLISARAFKALQGFDPLYFLYLEDVDFSWRAWLKGFRVLHEPLARCGHATGLHTYRKGRFYYEHFFSLRNFLVIAYKFFGEVGEGVAIEYLKTALLPKPLYRRILESYHSLRSSIIIQPGSGQNPEKIKILGLNLFHELQQ